MISVGFWTSKGAEILLLDGWSVERSAHTVVDCFIFFPPGIRVENSLSSNVALKMQRWRQGKEAIHFFFGATNGELLVELGNMNLGIVHFW